jgi:hypothetical protein
MHDCRVDGRDLAFIGTDNVRLGLGRWCQQMHWLEVRGRVRQTAGFEHRATLLEYWMEIVGILNGNCHHSMRMRGLVFCTQP